MARIELEVKFVKQAHYERPAYGYGYETVYIYKFEDSEGKIYVWKTTTILKKDGMDGEYDIMYTRPASEVFPYVGARIKIKATVKEESEYHGEKQTVINRVKVVDIIENGLSKEEKKESYKQKQLDSLKGGDFIWKKMPYRQYKNHYADCEKVVGSYSEDGTVDVIIREGRLKNSGVRGEHIDVYVFRNENNEPRCYRAVSVENAYARLIKDYPDHEWRYVAC